MAKYTSDANLIKGAGVAYKNWENVPGMYKGLEDLSKAGREMVAKEVAKRELEEKEAKKKAELKDKEANKEKKKQDDAWYKIAGDVYEKAGSFSQTVDYNYTVSKLTQLRKDLEAAEESGSVEDRADVMTSFNTIKAEVEDQKIFRDSIADPNYGLSDAVSNSGVEGGNNGKDKEFLTAFLAEKYTVSRNKEGDRTFTINGVTKTLKQIKKMAPLKDRIPFATYIQKVKEGMKATDFDEDVTKDDIRTNVIPPDETKLWAFLNDKEFGGKNFKGLLNNPKKDAQGKTNKDKIMEEINSTLIPDKTDDLQFEIFDTDKTTLGIDDKEYATFLEAIVDPYHEVWKDLPEGSWQEHATNIATEQLTNGVANAYYKANPDKINDEDENVLD